jgi:hypothetical protein
MRNKRVQLLPIQWRASLELELGEELMKQKEGLDNHFSLEGNYCLASHASFMLTLCPTPDEDITVGGTIPFIRDLTNKVLLDIPLYMRYDEVSLSNPPGLLIRFFAQPS